ncbi:MAG: response regulator [Deltaproteobacteria bacterium]|nr:response regulator [Deltaproteobacteria bacterium]
MRTPVLLLVDDEPEILRALTRAFRGKPYKLLTAGSAAEALNTIESTRVDVIISDYRMPGTDGIELLTQLAQIRPRMIRILISGYAEAERVLEACHGGEVDRFIPKPWETRTLIGAVGTLLDADAIRDRKEYLEALLESSPDAILIVDLEGRIVLANPSGMEMLDRSWDEVKQKRASTFLAGGAREYEAMLNRLAEEGRVVGHETSLTTPGGAVPVSVSLSSFLDGKGRVRGSVAIIKDISARKSTERALQKANRELRKANDEVSRAADDLSRLYGISSKLATVGDIDRLMEVAAPALLGDELAHVAGLALSGGTQWRGFIYVPERLDEAVLESGLEDFTTAVKSVSDGAGGQAGQISVLHVVGGILTEEQAGKHSDLLLPLSAAGRTLGHLWLRRYGKESYAAIHEQFLKTVALEMAMTLNRLFEAESDERRRIQALVEGMNEPVVMFDEEFRLL